MTLRPIHYTCRTHAHSLTDLHCTTCNHHACCKLTSQAVANKKSEPGAYTQNRTPPSCPPYLRISTPFSMSHTASILSSPEEMRMRELAEKQQDVTGALCCSKVYTALFFLKSHTITLRSVEQVARSFSFGEKTQHVTVSSCPISTLEQSALKSFDPCPPILVCTGSIRHAHFRLLVLSRLSSNVNHAPGLSIAAAVTSQVAV